MIDKTVIKLLPNFLTFLRIALTPICIYFLLQELYLLSLILFLCASFTDFLDGYFARKYNSISRLGAFLDPIADKLLVVGLFLSFYILNVVIDEYILFMIVFRDVFVTILRISMESKGVTMMTSKVAKVKTAVQFFVIFMLFLKLIFSITSNDRMIYCVSLVMAILTFYTGAHYLISNFRELKNLMRAGK